MVASLLYNSLVKRNSVYVTSILAAGFGFSIAFDVGVTAFWDRWNKGKQWKDIRERYVKEE